VKDKPWFLWLCYGAIHGPSTPAARHKGQYKGEPVEPPQDIFPPRPEKPAYLNKSQAWAKGPDGQPVAGPSGEAFGDESGKKKRTYAEWVRQVNECALALDEGIGKVLDALKESGQLENTLVIWTADQGFGMGEHGFRSKLGPYDATYNSPLVVSFAGKLPEGKVCKSPACAGDLVATIFAFAGMQQPWEFHGRDLTPVLKAPETLEAPRAMLFEHMGHYYGADTAPIPTDEHIYHNNVPRWIAIRYGKYKYIRTLLAGEMEEIYDVEADPEELTNLALKSEHAKLLTDLRERAIGELRKSKAPFADAMPATLQMGK
jgi:arylsulfatase A-like enzyme